MKRFLGFLLSLEMVALLLFNPTPARAYTQHVWELTSPDHNQTFAYGTEQNRVWVTRGKERHLALLLSYTNDPFVDRNNPRQYDNFTFNFPNVKLGSDGHTYYYRTPDGRSLPVAVKRSDFLGIDEIKLLPSSYLVIKKPHGYLTLTLVIQDHPIPRGDEE